ncbi:hypothetical protein [Deefgea sp. CFH1-16]|uniref:phage adaptor protein n=1 Tax=Deefgea sp. CFH1-16 TaxID=2675457 RepID=UPI0015F610CD|nr:hypothetical protein [Deefgea sp. CFH1-16]MBM5575830.1 hypothetical protein [Deefgea sp. CFH1-16]
MNFLQLVQRVQREAGMANQLIPSIAAADTLSPLHKNMVNWVIDAWHFIQNEIKSGGEWPFRQQFIDVVIPAGVNQLALSAIPAIKVKRIWLNGAPLCQRARLEYVLLPMAAAPRYFCTDSRSGYVQFNNAATSPITLKLDIITPLQTLALDTDVPMIDDDLQIRIVWRALMLFASAESMPDIYSMAQINEQQAAASMSARYGVPMKVRGGCFV